VFKKQYQELLDAAALRQAQELMADSLEQQHQNHLHQVQTSASLAYLDDEKADADAYIPLENVPPYPEHFDFGRLIDARIELRYIEHFLSNEECDEFISFADDKYVESQVIDMKSEGGSVRDESRTSATAYIYKGSMPTADTVERRAAALLQGNASHVESLQVVRYMPGQHFHAHYDWFYDDYKVKVQNQRLYTLFVYLNDVPEGQGAETAFPKLNISFKPRRGDALFWRDAKDVNTPLVESLHAGMPPIGNTIKYGLNIWYDFLPLGHNTRNEYEY